MKDGTCFYLHIFILLDMWKSFPTKIRVTVAPKGYPFMLYEFLEIVNQIWKMLMWVLAVARSRGESMGIGNCFLFLKKLDS